MPPHKQNRNYALEQQLMPKFQSRLEAQFAWKSAVSALMVQPGLRCAWSMSSVDSTPRIMDLGGAGRHLTVVNNGIFDADVLIPYFETDGATEYAYHVDHADFDLSANEAWIPSTAQGITVGGWFYFNTALVAGSKGLMSKYTSAGDQRAYWLYHNPADDTIRFSVSGNGIAVAASPASIIPTIDTWYCIFGRYDRTSLDVELFINGTWYTNAGAGPGAIFNSSARFEIHSASNGAAVTLWDGRSSLLSLYQRSVPNVALSQFYHQTRVMFGHV